MNHDKELTREELHQLVWSKPTRIAAKEFGLCDTGLAKVCRKLGVKKPPRGFWAKVASSLRVNKPPIGAYQMDALRKQSFEARRLFLFSPAGGTNLLKPMRHTYYSVYRAIAYCAIRERSIDNQVCPKRKKSPQTFLGYR